jgi:hypothetical protein
MRSSVLVVLVLSLTTLVWLTCAGSRPAFAPEVALTRPQLSGPQASAATVPSLQPVSAPAEALLLEPVAAASTESPRRSATDSDATLSAATSEGDLLEDGMWVDIDRTLQLASTHEGFNKLLQMLASSSSVEISHRQASY